MSTKERILAVIDNVPEGNLDELYAVVSDFAATHNGKHEPGIMERLRSIKKIQAPVDFATNLDQYTSGEKRVEDHLS
jgi:hypothetical protein